MSDLLLKKEKVLVNDKVASFFFLSDNRTYLFQADDEADLEA